MSGLRAVFIVLVLSATAHVAFAQGDPTGTISGRVTDPDNLALPGVSVSERSPALQGVRTAVTSANGDYIVPFLPAGEYTVTFDLDGFAAARHVVSLKMADRLPLNVTLAVGGVTEVVQVTAAASETATTATVATTLKSSTVEVIPIGRTLDAATLLAGDRQRPRRQHHDLGCAVVRQPQPDQRRRR